MPNIINLTPFDIEVLGHDTITPSGVVASLKTEFVDDEHFGGVCIRRQKFEVIDLPDPKEDTIFVVEEIVFKAIAGGGRKDVVTPDNGPDAVRNSRGVVMVVRRFIGS